MTRKVIPTSEQLLLAGGAVTEALDAYREAGRRYYLSALATPDARQPLLDAVLDAQARVIIAVAELLREARHG